MEASSISSALDQHNYHSHVSAHKMAHPISLSLTHTHWFTHIRAIKGQSPFGMKSKTLADREYEVTTKEEIVAFQIESD